jgi:hypothetical protein
MGDGFNRAAIYVCGFIGRNKVKDFHYGFAPAACLIALQQNIFFIFY